MNLRTVLVQAAEGLAVGFMEEAAARMRIRVSAEIVVPDAVSIGRRLARSLIEEPGPVVHGTCHQTLPAVRREAVPVATGDQARRRAT